MTDSRLERGAACERLAAQYLEARGMQVLARNLRCRAGEIDLIGLDADVIAIVEVRQRAHGDFGGALASVTWRKQRKLVRAAKYLLANRSAWRHYAMRFDVVAVEGTPDGVHHIHWIRHAFDAT